MGYEEPESMRETRKSWEESEERQEEYDEEQYDLGDYLFGRFEKMPRWGDFVNTLIIEAQGDRLEEMARLAREDRRILFGKVNGDNSSYRRYIELRSLVNVDGDRIAKEYRTLPCDLDDPEVDLEVLRMREQLEIPSMEHPEYEMPPRDDYEPGETVIDIPEEPRVEDVNKKEVRETPVLKLKYTPPEHKRIRGDKSTGNLFD